MPVGRHKSRCHTVRLRPPWRSRYGKLRGESRTVLVPSITVLYRVLWFAQAGCGTTSFESLSKITKHFLFVHAHFSLSTPSSRLFLSLWGCPSAPQKSIGQDPFFCSRFMCYQSPWLGSFQVRRRVGIPLRDTYAAVETQE